MWVLVSSPGIAGRKDRRQQVRLQWRSANTDPHMNSHERPHSKMGAALAGPGIHDVRKLPDTDFTDLWNSIVVDDQVKDRLLSQAILNFTLRPKVSRATLPLHGIILLAGVPGTGKTSLAKGLASRAAEALGAITYIEVEPHSLTSNALGKSQKAVTELGTRIGEYAASGRTIVLLDEVETLVADRSKMSLEANPVDVHRATDAALVQLDHLAAEFPNLLFVATSNFPQAIDEAFVSRADFVLSVPLPGEAAVHSILVSTLEGMAVQFPALARLANDPSLHAVAKVCLGLDGRKIRKLVAMACTFSKATALDPAKLTVQNLLEAAKHVQAEVPSGKGKDR